MKTHRRWPPGSRPVFAPVPTSPFAKHLAVVAGRKAAILDGDEAHPRRTPCAGNVLAGIKTKHEIR